MKFLIRHRVILLQLLSVLLVLIAIHFLAGLLPSFPRLIVNLIVSSIWVILGGTALIFLGLQIVQNFRCERSLIPDKLEIHPLPPLPKFRIHNPLDGPGSFYKTQLHTHSNLSYDSRISPKELIKTYQKDGYQILAITDHDQLADFSGYSTDNMLVLPGIEETVPVFFWPIPLGKHLVLINPSQKKPHSGTVQERLDQAKDTDSLVIPAHLSWRGGAGSGRWFPEELQQLRNLQFIEIESPHSRDPLDLTIWHKLIIENGPEHPVWGVAVDDSHNGSHQAGWIMVKSTKLNLPAVIASLKKGAFFATNGPLTLDIKVAGTTILLSAPGAVWIRFFNAQNQVIQAVRAEKTDYQCSGDEGFIRIEVKDDRQRTAWSQPMWLLPED